MKLMMWTFIVVVMLVVLVRARPEGSNSNGNEVAPADQVKEKNEMRQDGLFGNIFKIGKKLLPKVLGLGGHHHDNHDQGSNSNGNEVAPADQVKEKNEMRQDGLFGNIFKIGKKLLPKVLGLGGHHHDNHDQGSNSNGNEVAPADQVKEKNEMRQDGLFGNLFKMGKKLLPKVLGHAGHDNHDQDYNDGNEKVAKDFFRAKMPTPCKEAVMKCNQRPRPIKTNPFDILAECCRDYKEICLHDPKLCGAYLPGL